MSPLKIVVTGPVCSGKTTFIATLADKNSTTTEARTTRAGDKETTTVGLDFGQLTVRGRETTLFGTPGQDRFDYLWDILTEGADGVVVLVPADHPTPSSARGRTPALARAHDFAERLPLGSDVPMVIGVTRTDLVSGIGQAAGPAEVEQPLVSVTAVDARDPTSSRALLAALVTAIS